MQGGGDLRVYSCCVQKHLLLRAFAAPEGKAAEAEGDMCWFQEEPRHRSAEWMGGEDCGFVQPPKFAQSKKPSISFKTSLKGHGKSSSHSETPFINEGGLQHTRNTLR